MMMVSTIKRRLKEGKTYENSHKAWYHATRFGNASESAEDVKPPLEHLYTVVNVSDPRYYMSWCFFNGCTNNI